MARVLSVIMVALALIDGLVHLALNILVTHGIFTRPPLSDLFFLNFLGYLVLVGLFLGVRSGAVSTRRLVDAAFVVYPILTLAAWLYFTKGRANPMGLADISKPAEVLLAVAALLHVGQLGRAEEAHTVQSHA